jgi:hypothetical protein
MDDALNEAFSEAVQLLHARAALLDVEDDFDFGSPHEYWIVAAQEAIRRVQRLRLVALLAPTGARVLRRRSYRGMTTPDLAEDLTAWTCTWALSRGQLSAEEAGRALQLWLRQTPAMMRTPQCGSSHAREPCAIPRSGSAPSE